LTTKCNICLFSTAVAESVQLGRQPQQTIRCITALHQGPQY